jgi:hypothetical protein
MCPIQEGWIVTYCLHGGWNGIFRKGGGTDNLAKKSVLKNLLNKPSLFIDY